MSDVNEPEDVAPSSVWIVQCHIQDRVTDDSVWPEEFDCTAAVRAVDDAEARNLVGVYLEVSPHKLIEITHCAAYDEVDDEDAEAHRLAAEVHSAHLVEFGPLQSRSSDDASKVSDSPSSFREALLACDPESTPICAVLDGAFFDNLPALLSENALYFRPLFIDTKGRGDGAMRSAPCLVPLAPNPDVPDTRNYADLIDCVLHLMEGKPAGVFWQCEAGVDALFDHLRRINKIMIPYGAMPNGRRGFVDEKGETHAVVLFRHADANVLAQTMSAMEPVELAKLFGPSNAVLLAPEPDWARGEPWLQVLRAYVWPDPAPGMMRLSQDTMDRMSDVRVDRLIFKTKTYLRKVLPGDFQHLPDKALEKSARASRERGRALGLRTQAAHNRWAYLSVITEGKIAESPEVESFITRGNGTPDEQVKQAMAETLQTMKTVAAEL